MELIEVLESLKKSIERFLDKTSIKEEEDWSMEQKINCLEDIVDGRNRDFWRIKDRFKGLEDWLKTESVELKSKLIKEKHIQRVIECLLKMKAYWDMWDEKKKSSSDGMKALVQVNSFIRDNLRRGGWEYTPLGLTDLGQWDDSLLKLKEEIRTLEKSETDLKGGYHRILTYQLDLLDYFFKPKDHLLTILNYQLKSLETKSTDEDEFFIATLLYYLKQHRYKMEPYLERFRKVLKKQKKDLNKSRV